MVDKGYDLQFDDYFELAIRLPGTGNQAFVIHRMSDDAVIGMTRAVPESSQKKEGWRAGHTWYIPSGDPGRLQ